MLSYKKKEVVERREVGDIQPLSDQFHPGDLTPCLKSDLQSGTVFPGVQTVTARLEVPSDGAKGGEKALGMFGRFKFPHFLLSQACGLMRIFCPVVQSFVLPMLHTRQDLAFRCAIANALVSDDDARHILEVFEQLAKETFGSMLIASALDQDVEHVAVLINGSPEDVLFSTNGKHDLIQIPLVPTTRATTTKVIGIGLTKFETPLPDRFIGYYDASLRQKLFNRTEN